MNKKHHYSDQELSEAVASSTSLRQVKLALGVKDVGSFNPRLKKEIERLDLDTSHFTGKVWNKGKTFNPIHPLSYYLKVWDTNLMTSHKLKLRLIKENVFQHQCSNCKGTTWMNNAIPLELDHINGIHNDNRIENLRLLCPNCHAMTPTYGVRNRKKS